MTDCLLSAGDLAQRTGKTARYFQKLAADGKLNWATQPNGPGTAWLFEEVGFQDWLAGGCKGRGGKWRASTKGAKPTTRGRPSRAVSDASPFRQRLEQLLKTG